MKKIIVLSIAMMLSGMMMAQNAKDFLRMGDEHLANKDWNKAIESFSYCIKLQPDYQTLYKAHYGRGFAYFNLTEYKLARTDFDRSIRIFPNDPEVYFWRAYTKYHMGQSASSEISDYNRAILLKPDYAEAYFNRGEAKIKNNQKSAGCKDLRKALELGFKKAEFELKLHCEEQ